MNDDRHQRLLTRWRRSSRLTGSKRFRIRKMDEPRAAVAAHVRIISTRRGGTESVRGGEGAKRGTITAKPCVINPEVLKGRCRLLVRPRRGGYSSCPFTGLLFLGALCGFSQRLLRFKIFATRNAVHGAQCCFAKIEISHALDTSKQNVPQMPQNEAHLFLYGLSKFPPGFRMHR